MDTKAWTRMCRVNKIAWSATRLGSIPCACKYLEQKMNKSFIIMLYQVNNIIIKWQENRQMEEIQLTSCSTHFDSWSFDSCLQSKQINLYLHCITHNYSHNTNRSCYNWRKGCIIRSPYLPNQDWKQQNITCLLS